MAMLFVKDFVDSYGPTLSSNLFFQSNINVTISDKEALSLCCCQHDGSLSFLRDTDQ